MQGLSHVHAIRKTLTFLFLTVALLMITSSFAANAQPHTSTPFAGTKANTGTVIHSKEGKKNILTLSDDFKTPDTPDPH